MGGWNTLTNYGDLKWVIVSSIVNEAINTISSRIIFFLRKDFERTKTQINQHQPTKTKISKQKTTKATVFCTHKTVEEGRNRSKRVEIMFWVLVLFVRSKSFHKKNWLEIVLIASYTILVICTPINPPIEGFFVRTYFYL